MTDTNLPEWTLPIRDEMAREVRHHFQVEAQAQSAASRALAVALPLIAEHMAGVADDHYLSTPDDDHQLGQADCASNIAAAIRQEATPRKP